MAYLNKDDRREAWIAWGIEFVRRGLWPSPDIEVHGPHSPTDWMWGQAEAETHDGMFAEVSFRTASGIRGIHDVRGVTITSLHDSIESGTQVPLLETCGLEHAGHHRIDRIVFGIVMACGSSAVAYP